jgi:RNA polymerase sigma-70 factor (ECF subfamily)
MQTIKAERRDLGALPDDELVALVRRGQGEAFAAIMQRYNRRLYRVARGITRDDGEAEDVLQEAYVCAFAALAGFRGEASLSTWLTRIVLNEALSRMRKRRPTEELEALDRVDSNGGSTVIMFPGRPRPIPKRRRRGPRFAACSSARSISCPSRSASSSCCATSRR